MTGSKFDASFWEMLPSLSPVADRLVPEFAAPDILAHEIAAYLEADIIALRLPPGQRLIEEEIGRRFGVSRSPIREAMRLLESSGLVQRSPRRGSMVAPVSLADLDAVSACRVPLEALASAGAARHATAAQRLALAAALRAMEAATAGGDAEAAFAANVAMTDLVHEACGNPVLARLLSGVNKLALRYRFISYRRLPELVGSSLAANRELVDAIERHDPDAAHRTTESLIRANWAAAQGLLREA